MVWGLYAYSTKQGGTHMKKLTKVFAIATISIFLGVSQPVIAQNNADTTTTRTADDADDDGDDEWGLIGLLGLAGLLGLKRRDRDDRRTTTATTNPNTMR